MPATSFTIDRRDAEQRLTTLRRERGVAKLDGKAFDDDTITQAESAIDALSEAEAEATRRERTAAAAAIAERLKALAADLKAREEERLSAVGRAEKAARQLVAALDDAADIVDRMKRVIGQMGRSPPLVLDTSEMRLGERLRAVVTGRLPGIVVSATWRKSTDDWVVEERKALASVIEKLPS
jgi:hypothetical protein